MNPAQKSIEDPRPMLLHAPATLEPSSFAEAGIIKPEREPLQRYRRERRRSPGTRHRALHLHCNLACSLVLPSIFGGSLLCLYSFMGPNQNSILISTRSRTRSPTIESDLKPYVRPGVAPHISANRWMCMYLLLPAGNALMFQFLEADRACGCLPRMLCILSDASAVYDAPTGGISLSKAFVSPCHSEDAELLKRNERQRRRGSEREETHSGNQRKRKRDAGRGRRRQRGQMRLWTEIMILRALNPRA